MRVTRAYLAGFGTAGSILAGWAVLFVVASAVVAFRGWPMIAGQPAPAVLRLDGPVPASDAGSGVTRRLAPLLAAASAATRAGVGRPVRGAARGRRSAFAGLRRPPSGGRRLGAGPGQARALAAGRPGAGSGSGRVARSTSSSAA